MAKRKGRGDHRAPHEALVAALEAELDPETRAALWLRVLLKMSEDDALGLRWEDVGSSVVQGRSGTKHRATEAARRVLAAMPRFTSNPHVFYSLNREASRNRLAEAWGRMIAAAGLAGKSPRELAKLAATAIRGGYGPDFSDYERGGGAGEPFPGLQMVPLAFAENREMGAAVVDVPRDKIDDLVGHLRWNENDEDFARRLDDLHLIVGSALARIRLSRERDASPPVREQIDRVRRMAVTLAGALELLSDEARQAIEVEGFSPADQQLTALKSCATPLTIGEGRALVDGLEENLARCSHEWLGALSPMWHPAADLLRALERACKRAEEKLPTAGRPAETIRDGVMRQLAAWFRDQTVEDDLGDLDGLACDFVQDCLAVIEINITTERIQQILAT